MRDFLIVGFLTAVTVFIIYHAIKGKSFLPKGKIMRGKEKYLWDSCRQALNMSAKEADEVIKRSLQRLRENHPGKSEEWYLDKFLYDLQRDRN